MTEEEDNRNSVGRRDYDDANAALGRHIVENDRRLRKFFRGALIAMSIIGFFTAVSLVGFGIVLSNQNEQTKATKRLALENQKLVEEVKKQAQDIQKQRRDSIITSCEETNKRHDGSVKALREGSDIDQKNAPNEAARAEIRRRRDVTIALLDALAPPQDCEALASSRVKEDR